MTLLDAICDDALLGPAFAGPTWRPWHAFLRTIDGVPLSGQDLDLYRQCTGRQRPPDQPAKEVYAIIGRRGGKSRLAAAIAVEAACLKDWTPHLAVGERATIALIAADRQQSRIVMEYVRGLLTSTPLLAQRIERETDTAIDLVGSVSIEVTTCSSRTTRGYSFCLVIGDEAAFWKSETSSEPDVEVLQAVRPGLSTLPGARLICISSPYSRHGVLWQAFKAHHGQDDDPVVVWVADSQTMNPALDPAVVAAAYEADPGQCRRRVRRAVSQRRGGVRQPRGVGQLRGAGAAGVAAVWRPVRLPRVRRSEWWLAGRHDAGDRACRGARRPGGGGVRPRE